MFQKLESVENHYNALSNRLNDPKIFEDQELYRKTSSEYSELTPLIEAFRDYKRIEQEIENNQNLLQDDDEEIQDLAKEEIQALQEKQQEITASLRHLLLPKAPHD